MVTVGIEDKLNEQKIYLDTQMTSYDEKFNVELKKNGLPEPTEGITKDKIT